MTVINPLVEDLGGLKDSEVEDKINDLSKKYWLTRNPDIQYQISCFIQIYKDEMSMRRAKAWDAQNQKRNKDLDNLIQIN